MGLRSGVWEAATEDTRCLAGWYGLEKWGGEGRSAVLGLGDFELS